MRVKGNEGGMMRWMSEMYCKLVWSKHFDDYSLWRTTLVINISFNLSPTISKRFRSIVLDSLFSTWNGIFSVYHPPPFLPLSFYLLFCHWFRVVRLPRKSDLFMVSGFLHTCSGPVSQSWSWCSWNAKLSSLLPSFKHAHLYTAPGHFSSGWKLYQDNRAGHVCKSGIWDSLLGFFNDPPHIVQLSSYEAHGREKGYHSTLFPPFLEVPPNVWTLICVSKSHKNYY